MSKRARALALGVTLAAMNLAGTTAVAQANDQPTSNHDARRPPTERQVGEAWRHHQVASQQQAAADTAQRRLLAQEQAYDPSAPPAQAPAPTRAAEPSGQPDWLVASLGVLAAALTLLGGLALLAAKRASRRARVRHAA
jgi:hypothetical protein